MWIVEGEKEEYENTVQVLIDSDDDDDDDDNSASSWTKQIETSPLLSNTVDTCQMLTELSICCDICDRLIVMLQIIVCSWCF